MNKKISLGAAIAYMAIVAAVAFSLTMIYSMNLFNVKMTGITEREKMYASLHEVDLYVRENFYGSINEEELQEAIARGYIDGLEDGNARYFTAEEYEPIPSPAAASMSAWGSSPSRTPPATCWCGRSIPTPPPRWRASRPGRSSSASMTGG